MPLVLQLHEIRHQIDYGTTEDQFGAVAVTIREHAVRNPEAVMRMPMTLEDHNASRMIAEPLRLFDCNIETNGACAMIVTSVERARDLRHRPAVIKAGALGAGSHHRRLSALFDRDREEDSAVRTGRRLFASAGVSPSDIDCAFFYDFFTSFVIIALEAYGFCKRSEGDPFVENGGLSWNGGRLPTNTNRGQLSEAFIHGVNNSLEAVRQIRGMSTSQVEGCELVLVAGANKSSPASASSTRISPSSSSAAPEPTKPTPQTVDPPEASRRQRLRTTPRSVITSANQNRAFASGRTSTSSVGGGAASLGGLNPPP